MFSSRVFAPNWAAGCKSRRVERPSGYWWTTSPIYEVWRVSNKVAKYAKWGGADLDAIRQRMQQMRALREQYLSTEVIVAFFGEEDAYDRYTLARLELMRDKTLSAQARAQQLAELERQLPEGLQESLKAVNQYLNLKTLTDEWKQHAGSAEELYQIRMSLVGAEATARLEALDQENIAWDRRMSEWFAQRDELLKTPGLSREDRERQLEELRRGSFSSEAERLRVEALERINDAGQP